MTHHSHRRSSFARHMAFSNWLPRFFPKTAEEGASEPLDEDNRLREEFNDKKMEFEQSAISLFHDEEDDSPKEKVEVATPEYDAGEVDVLEILASYEMEDFSATNEIEIVDVSNLNDPYENAKIVGDISHRVELEENNGTVAP